MIGGVEVGVSSNPASPTHAQRDGNMNPIQYQFGGDVKGEKVVKLGVSSNAVCPTCEKHKPSFIESVMNRVAGWLCPIMRMRDAPRLLHVYHCANDESVKVSGSTDHQCRTHDVSLHKASVLKSGVVYACARFHTAHTFPIEEPGHNMNYVTVWQCTFPSCQHTICDTCGSMRMTTYIRVKEIVLGFLPFLVVVVSILLYVPW